MQRANLIMRANRWENDGSLDLTYSKYRPFLTVRDVASRGRSHRIYSWTSQRLHHLFSDLETKAFYVLDYLKGVDDIREQYPLLPLDETLEIADEQGVKHPSFGGQLHIMTTDFLITKSSGHLVAIQVKLLEELESSRTNEKLEIEREYWHRRNIPFQIVTEKEIPSGLAKSVSWIHQYIDGAGIKAGEMDIHDYALTLVDWLNEYRETALAKACQWADERYKLSKGTSLSVARYALARRMLRVTIINGVNTLKPLTWLDEAQ
ncbi:MAG: TnsA endonuclease N-terminal domain-containing protein [Cycloclasticus sp.]|nr:TnsA endonuclease N-terminal domain-containing protein [Cycloclasticus sp.]